MSRFCQLPWLVGFIASLLLVGCAKHGVQLAPQEVLPPGLDDVRVVHIFNPRTIPSNSGTAVPIGGNRLASCRHNFPPYVDSLWIDGKTVPIAMELSGARDDSLLEDWCVFSVPDGVAEVAPHTIVDFTYPVNPGQKIYLIGFYGGRHHGISEATAKSLSRVTVPGTVTEAPEAWQQVSSSVIFVQAPEPDAYHGISGGAAVVHDEVTGCWVIVGIYRGAVVERQSFLWWSKRTRTYHTVLRLSVD